MGENRKVKYTAMSWRYGITNGFSTMISTVASTYWAIFLTDSVGLQTVVMASILSIASLVDLISVPIIGVIMQKASFKSGKFRPWLLLGAVITGLFRWLSFTNVGLTGTAQALWFGGAYILAYFGYNLAYSAYSGILPLLATDPTDRQAYSASKTMCNSIGKFVFSLTSVYLISLFGQGNDAKGYSVLVFVIAVLVIGAFSQLFVGIKDVDVAVKKEEKAVKAEKDEYQVSLWEMIKFSISKPFLIYLVGASCKGSAYFIIMGLAAYYYTYVVGDKGMLTVYLSLSTFLMIGGSFVAPFISNKLKGAKQTYRLGIAIYAVCLAMAFFFGKSAIAFTVLLCAGYVGFSIAHATEITIYTSVVDYAQWKTGKDLKPFMMSLFNLVPKIGTTVGSLVMGYGLVAVGFNANNVTDSAVAGIRVLFSALPAAILVLGVIMFIIFPLTDDKVRDMQAEIKARKEAEK